MGDSTSVISITALKGVPRLALSESSHIESPAYSNHVDGPSRLSARAAVSARAVTDAQPEPVTTRITVSPRTNSIHQPHKQRTWHMRLIPVCVTIVAVVFIILAIRIRVTGRIRGFGPTVTNTMSNEQISITARHAQEENVFTSHSKRVVEIKEDQISIIRDETGEENNHILQNDREQNEDNSKTASGIENGNGEETPAYPIDMLDMDATDDYELMKLTADDDVSPSSREPHKTKQIASPSPHPRSNPTNIDSNPHGSIHQPDFQVLVVNLDRSPQLWKRMQTVWRPIFPHLTRLRATEFPKGKKRRSNRQALNTSIMRALLSLQKNNDSFVIIMEDDAVPTSAFQEMWPYVLAEARARTAEWDIIHTGARFTGRAADPIIERVNCSRVFVNVDRAHAAQMILYNRSVLKKATKWIARLQAGEDVLTNDIYFTVNSKNGTREKETWGHPATFVQWHPRVSLTTQSAHLSETQGGMVNVIAKLAKDSQLIEHTAEALGVPPLDTNIIQPPLEGCPSYY